MHNPDKGIPFVSLEDQPGSEPVNAKALSSDQLLQREREARLQTGSTLKERVKELACLWELSRLTEHAGTAEDLLAQCVKLLPPAMQFPECAVARIRLGDKVFETGSLESCQEVLRSEMKGLAPSDTVEIGYLEQRPFLAEEVTLLEMVSERLGLVIERLNDREALRRSEQRFRLLTDNTLDVIWSVNSDLEVTYVNPAVTRLTGYTPEEYIGRQVKAHFSETEMEVFRQTIQEALSAGSEHPGVIRELHILDRNGNEVPVEIHAKVLYDEHGRQTGLQGTSRDIRERRRTLEALRESEEKYRTLFETMAQGVIFQGTQGEILSANPAAQRILGLTLDEMVGRTSEDDRWRAIKENGAKYPAEEHPSMIALKTAKAVRDDLMGVFNPRDGEYRWLKVSAAPQFRPGEDTPFQVFSTFEDVTELRRVEAQRQAANLFSSELLESIRDGFFALDRQLRVTYLNGSAETLMGKPREQVVGRNFFEAFPEKLGSLVEEKCRQALAEQVELDFEFWCEPHQQWYHVQIDPSATGISIFFRDITHRKNSELERQEIESQLRQAQKLEAVGRLAGGLAHDFNNMLSVILGHAELALNCLEAEDPLHDDLSEIIEAGQRSASLTRQLLAFARKQTISPKILDLNRSVAGILKMLKRLIGEDIDLVWNPGPIVSTIKMDPSQLDQVLTNLVVNARDAIEGVGSIIIETRLVKVDNTFCRQHQGFQPCECVVLAVRDTGTGIDSESLPNLFEPFFTTKPEGRGTGLGLAMVHGVVQQNGGTVVVSSEVGKGSTFEVYLPAVVKDAVSEGSTTSSQVDPGQETVLLVEDEPSLLRLTARMLKGLGYKVVAAGSPKEALRLCENSERFDLLLTDVVMPEMSGAQLSERIKEIYPGLKCLFMSGYTSDAIGERGGVLDNEIHFLQKPFSRAELASKTREALGTL